MSVRRLVRPSFGHTSRQLDMLLAIAQDEGRVGASDARYIASGEVPCVAAPSAVAEVRLHTGPVARPAVLHLVRSGARTHAGKLAHIREEDCFRRHDSLGDRGDGAAW